jgi:DNA-binding response OmpR family regulator
MDSTSTEPAIDVLIIDDSLSQTAQFSLILQRAGYQVASASTSMTGVEKAQILKPRLILLDVNLPVLNGFQVLARLKRSTTTKDIPVIMMTAQDHVYNDANAAQLGAAMYLLKQAASETLVPLVNDVLGVSIP